MDIPKELKDKILESLLKGKDSEDGYQIVEIGADELPADIKQQMMAKIAGSKTAKRNKNPQLPEAALETLKEFQERYDRPIPFVVGDLVHPRTDSNYRRTGLPELVLEVDGSRRVHWVGEPGSAGFGGRFDMRIATLVDGTIATFWVESCHYEAWPGPIR